MVEVSQVRPHDLVAVHKDDAVNAEREEHVEEEDLVGPDDALLLSLEGGGGGGERKTW